jgi:hypothetical protein
MLDAPRCEHRVRELGERAGVALCGVHLEIVAGPHGGGLRAVDEPPPIELLDDLRRVALERKDERDQASE